MAGTLDYANLSPLELLIYSMFVAALFYLSARPWKKK